MRRSVKLALTIGAVSLAVSLPVNPAKAQFNWTQVPGMVDVPGRITDTEKQILEELAAGRLTAAKADELKKKLEAIKVLDTQYRADGKLSIFERMKLILELDNLGKDIQLNLGERKVAITDVPGRQTELSKKIADAVIAGQITSLEATNFNTQLQSVKDREKTFRADGSLSTTETLQLSLALDQLNSELEKSMKTRVITDPGIATKKSEIEKKIASLLASGKITSAQADPLKNELERIKTKEKLFQTSGGTMDSQEVLTIALELERLKSQVDRFEPVQVTSAVKGIDTRQADVKKMIAEAQTNGKLTAAQASELAHEFDRIEALEAMYRVDGKLSDSEILTLARDLDTLKKNTETQISKAKASAPSLKERRDALRKKITEAKTQNRIKPASMADEFLAELSRIETKETFYNIDGKLNDTETLIIAKDIDLLNSRFESNLQKIPSVAERKTKLETLMNGALASGRLTTKQAEDVRKELTRVGFLESTFKGNDGVIDDNEAVALNREYDSIDKKLSAVLPKLPDVAKMREDLNKKVEQGAAKGTFSAQKANELKTELARISNIEKSFRASDNALAEWETMALKRDLEKLATQIDTATSAPAKKVADVKIDTSKVAADTRGHWAEKYIAILQQNGTIGGFPDGTFKPNNGITRAQFAAIATKALDLPPAGRPSKFNDLSKKQWFYKAVSAVSEAGLVGGYPDGTFRPNDKITRTQAFVILSKALKNANADSKVLGKYKDGKKVPAWAIPSVAKAANAGILVNHPDAFQIRPADQATRAEVAALTYQTMSNLGKELPKLTIGLEAAEKSTN